MLRRNKNKIYVSCSVDNFEWLLNDVVQISFFTSRQKKSILEFILPKKKSFSFLFVLTFDSQKVENLRSLKWPYERSEVIWPSLTFFPSYFWNRTKNNKISIDFEIISQFTCDDRSFCRSPLRQSNERSELQSCVIKGRNYFYFESLYGVTQSLVYKILNFFLLQFTGHEILLIFFRSSFILSK